MTRNINSINSVKFVAASTNNVNILSSIVVDGVPTFVRGDDALTGEGLALSGLMKEQVAKGVFERTVHHNIVTYRRVVKPAAVEHAPAAESITKTGFKYKGRRVWHIDDSNTYYINYLGRRTILSASEVAHCATKRSFKAIAGMVADRVANGKLTDTDIERMFG